MMRLSAERYRTPQVLAVVLTGLVVVAGGSWQAPVQAALLIVIGIWTFITPPHKGLSYTLSIGWLCLLGWTLLQLLPFGYPSSEWRMIAVSLGLTPASGISPQPLVSAEAIVLLLAGMAWFYQMASLPVNPERRETALQVLAVVMAILGFSVFYLTISGVRNPLAPELQVFSFLPNRNQMSLMIAAAGIVGFALGFEHMSKNRPVGVFFLAMVALCATGLIASLSRSGIIIFFLGCGIWMWRVYRRKKSLKEHWKWVTPFAVWLIGGLLFLGGQASTRLRGFLSGGIHAADDFRMAIYRDAASMFRDAPWTGVGLGNFEYIFPQYRFLSVSGQHAVHPESSVFWFLLEGGIIGSIFIAIILLGVIRAVFDTERHVDRYRQIATVTLAVCLLQALVDVPMHRLGVFLLFGLLFGLARVSSRRPHRPLWLPSAAWRALGALIAVVGLLWLPGPRLPFVTNSESAVERGEIALRQAMDAGMPHEELWSVLDAGSGWLPLDWRMSLLKGRAHLLEEDLESARKAFRQARFLEPHHGPLAMNIGEAMLPHSLPDAVHAFSEALGSRVFLEDDRVFLHVRRHLDRIPGASESIEQLSRLRPDYRVQYVVSLRGDVLRTALTEEFERPVPFADWPPRDLLRILSRYVDEGNAATMLSFLETMDDDDDFWWKLRVIALTRAGKLEHAVRIIGKNIEPPRLPEYGTNRSESSLRALLRYNPRDYAAVAALVRRYYEQGRTEEALDVLDRVIEFRDRPTFVCYWRAKILWELGRGEEALVSWNDFLIRN